MKTKTEIFVLVEIAVVLCSMFLVTLPAIAAEQTTQNVNANTITTASEDDYVLGIYGNANEDDTIDMRDLTYVKLIFFGKKPETELADAKYDGKINPLDFIQIKLIIVGKEKEITIVDSADRIVTVKKPIKKIVSINPRIIETLRSLKTTDKVVAVPNSIITNKVFFPEFGEYINVGSARSPDLETVLELRPDVVFLYATWAVSQSEEAQKKLESADPTISVIRIDAFKTKSYVEEVEKLGYILGKKSEKEEFLNFYQGWLNTVKERVEKLSEADKPKVYHESNEPYKTVGVGTGFHQQIVAAGGINIFDDLSGYPVIDAEEVITRNPEIIVQHTTSKVSKGCYLLDVGDTTELKKRWEEIMNRKELQAVTAVKKGNVYIINWDVVTGVRHFVGIGYQAKWFHPELFEDLNPKAVHQEYITKFQGLDIDLDKKGVFVYHPEEHPDGQ